MQTILIVDDSKLARLSLVRLIDSKGIRVMEAEGVLDAEYVITRNTKPDLIFMDIAMPKLDGFAGLSRIKSNPATASIPVVMYSGDNSNKTKQKAIEMGAAEFLTKPAQQKELLAIIEKLLPAKKETVEQKPAKKEEFDASSFKIDGFNLDRSDNLDAATAVTPTHTTNQPYDPINQAPINPAPSTNTVNQVNQNTVNQAQVNSNVNDQNIANSKAININAINPNMINPASINPNAINNNAINPNTINPNFINNHHFPDPAILNSLNQISAQILNQSANGSINEQQYKDLADKYKNLSEKVDDQKANLNKIHVLEQKILIQEANNTQLTKQINLLEKHLEKLQLSQQSLLENVGNKISSQEQNLAQLNEDNRNQKEEFKKLANQLNSKVMMDRILIIISSGLILILMLVLLFR